MNNKELTTTIMVVDDTPDNLTLIRDMLQKWGYRVLAFPNGRMALNAAAKNPPDIILLDILMPEMDGFEVARHLKTDETLQEIPILFISALGDTKNKVKAFAAGGVDYVTKPFQIEEVQARVETHLRLRRMSLELGRHNLHLEEKVAERTQMLEQANQQLTASEAKFKSYIQNAPDGIFIANEKGKYIEVNKAACEITGYSEDELHKLTIPELIQEEYSEKAKNHFQTVVKEGFASGELGCVTKSGENRFWSVDAVKLSETRFLGFAKDITKRKQAEKQIQQNLSEKTILIQEIYHRTKNNMAVIKAMLSMESTRSDNDYVKSTFREISNKIRTMSLFHQKLYQAQDLSNIDLNNYIKDLTKLVMRSYVFSKKIEFKFEMQDISISIDSAVPLGLIINELISNVFKHAFPNRQKGEIFIRLFREKDKTINLELADNGIGFQRNFNPRKDGSMGLDSVFSIVENQLRGEISVKSENGLKWQIKIKDNLYKKRV